MVEMLLGLENPADSQVKSTGKDLLSTTLSHMTVLSFIYPQMPSSAFDVVGVKFNVKVFNFLNSNFDVFLRLPEIINSANIVAGYDLQPELELIEDEESGDVARLGFVYTITNQTYDEILDLWDKISAEVYKNLDIETSKKISIILHGE